MRALALALAAALLSAGAARAGATRCRLENGAIVVPAAFGDIAGDFLLDAAQPVSELHVTTALSFGITDPAPRADLRLAGELLPGVTLKVTDLGARAWPFAAGLVGVIGADVLAHRVIEIDNRPCRVRLLARPPRLRRAVRLKLRVIGRVLATRAAVSDGLTAWAGWFAVATAAPGVTIEDARLTRPLGSDSPPGWPPAVLRALSLGDLLFEQVPADVGPAPAAGLDGAIGEDVWFRYRMVLDPAAGALWLAPPP